MSADSDKTRLWGECEAQNQQLREELKRAKDGSWKAISEIVQRENESLRSELAAKDKVLEESIDKQKLLTYHRERIEHLKQFRKEFKDGSYSLQEACEIRIDTHQVVINLIESGSILSPGGDT